MNLIAYDTSYNGECWFLLPYVLLSITAPLLFRITEKVNWKIVLSVTFVINICTSFIISRYGEKYLYHNMLIYNPLLYFHLMFSFMLGATVVRTNALDAIFNFSKRLLRNSALRWLTVVLLFILPCIISLKVFYSFYALAMIVAFTIAPKSEIVSRSFTCLGKHSMNMWMIHTWFSSYLFHGFIYGFKYPAAIFLMLLLVSLGTSLVVNSVFSLSSFIYSRIANKTDETH